MVAQSAVDGEILQLPVRVLHVHNVRSWLPTLRYTPMWRITFKAITFVNVTCVCHSHSRLQRQNPFFRLTKMQFIDTVRDEM